MLEWLPHLWQVYEVEQRTKLFVLLTDRLTLWILKAKGFLQGYCFMWLVGEGINFIKRQVTHVFKAMGRKVGTYDFLFAA